MLLHLFALFLLVTLGFYVFVANPRNRAHQTFAAFIAFLACWITKDLIFWNFYPVDQASGWWVAASFVIALLMQFAMVVFAWVFPENARTPRQRAAVLFAPSLFLVPAAAFGLLWHRAGFEDGRFVIDLSPLAYAFVIYVYVVYFYGAAVLFGKYRRYRGTQAGQQVGAIIWGLAITGVLKTVANIILPYFGYYGLLPLSALFVLPGVVIYAYAILNFRLFSLQSALTQFRLFPITYKVALIIASVAIISFLLFQIPIAWWAFRNGMDYEAWRRYLVFSVISALVPNLLLVLLILRTISRPLQRITLAAVEVAKGSYGTEVDMRPTNDEIGLLADSFNEMSRKMAADIDQLQHLNAHLIRTEKLASMGTLSAGVAHEVNNPLASISSLIQMLQAKGDLPGDAREKLDLIAAQVKRISQVTGDLTNFARARPAARSAVDVGKVVAAALRLASFDDSFKKLVVHADLGESLPVIHADADQIQQVALNLVLNSRDAMPNGGDLAVRVYANSADVVISIADTGKGIDADTAEHIFDPFYTTKPAGKGTGLGLAVCYGIITAHGGSIEVAQNSPTGTIFTVSIPISGEI
ncbi:MAG TPA: ATP-binding protein [Pyrinomonadaceae bacterium]|nr:HAMP domain-containing protein [Chloracidobacterium sp.]HQX56683.1 ATP-binding protein [Pyrinomonadaceae bacterium]